MEIATACLSDRVLGGGKHVGGRDRQDVVAGIAFEGSVFRILDFLNDCLSTIEGLDLALLRQAAQQRVVLGDVIGQLLRAVVKRSGGDFRPICIWYCHSKPQICFI